MTQGKTKTRVIQLSAKDTLVITILPGGKEHLVLVESENLKHLQPDHQKYRKLAIVHSDVDPEDLLLAILAFNLQLEEKKVFRSSHLSRLLWKLSYFGAKKSVARLQALMNSPLNGYALSASSEFDRIFVVRNGTGINLVICSQPNFNELHWKIEDSSKDRAEIVKRLAIQHIHDARFRAILAGPSLCALRDVVEDRLIEYYKRDNPIRQWSEGIKFRRHSVNPGLREKSFRYCLEINPGGNNAIVGTGLACKANRDLTQVADRCAHLMKDRYKISLSTAYFDSPEDLKLFSHALQGVRRITQFDRFLSALPLPLYISN